MSDGISSHYQGLLQAQTLLQYDTQHNLPKGSVEQRAQETASLTAEIERNDGPFVRDASLSAYQQLEHTFHHYNYLNSAKFILEWMLETKDYQESKPDETIVNDDALKEAMGALALSALQLLSQPDMERLLDAAAQQDLSEPQRRNLQLMRRTWVIKTSVAEADEVAWAQLTADGRKIQSKLNRKWKEQRKLEQAEQDPEKCAALEAQHIAENKGDFEQMRPVLTQIFDMAARRGAGFAKKLGLATAYEGLLAEINPDISQEQMNSVFDAMRTQAPQFIREAQQVQQKKPALDLPPAMTKDASGNLVAGPAIPEAVQWRIVQRLGQQMGFDFNRGRVDLSGHPFTSDNLSDDKRVTVRFKADDPFASIFSAMHEFGHGLYEQALPKEWRAQPLGLYNSIWLHESQSMFWDHHVAMTPEFFQFLQPILVEEMRNAFPDRNFNGPEWSAENLYRLNAEVNPSLIRVEADAATYPLHLILRDVEREIINSHKDGPEKLAQKVGDMPQEWGKRAHELLGVNVPDDARGCLQDIHWPSGYIGYFPAYIFGTVAASQMKSAMLKGEIPDFADRIRQGDFKTIAGWLRTHIQQRASTVNGDQIMRDATGEPLSARSAEHWLSSMRSMLLDPYNSKARTTHGGKGREVE